MTVTTVLVLYCFWQESLISCRLLNTHRHMRIHTEAHTMAGSLVCYYSLNGWLMQITFNSQSPGGCKIQDQHSGKTPCLTRALSLVCIFSSRCVLVQQTVRSSCLGSSNRDNKVVPKGSTQKPCVQIPSR